MEHIEPITEEQLKKLDDLIAVQADHGNWDYSEYMYGLLNGMILARAVLGEANPDYPDRPEQWIQDFDALEKFNKSGAVIDELHIRGHRRSTTSREDALIQAQPEDQASNVSKGKT